VANAGPGNQAEEITRANTRSVVDDAKGESSPDRPFALSYRPTFSQSAAVSDLIEGLDAAKDIQDFCSGLAERVGGLF
jgi:hypothetical protein